MAATYTTAQIDQNIRTLEGILAAGCGEVQFSDGRRVRYNSVAEIRSAIAYWTAKYDEASDAPPQTPKKRTFFFWGHKGIGF